MKLKTADHISTIIEILTSDGWFLDLGWDKAKDDMEIDEVTLPDRATKKHNGLLMIEIAPKSYNKSDRPCWRDRADWENSRDSNLHKAPLPKSRFKRQLRKKVGNQIMRTFSTPESSLIVNTYEANDTIERIEFVQFAVPYIDERSTVIRTMSGSEIPSLNASSPNAKLSYDIVTEQVLTDAILDAAVAHMIAEGDYGTRAEVFADYQTLDLKTAVHDTFPLSRKVEDDLSTVEFYAENTLLEFDAPGFQGVNTIGDLTFASVMAGGDWEQPIVFILYISNGELRGFIPDEGNVYDRKTMMAYGNGDDDEDILEKLSDSNWDVDMLLSGIAKAFAITNTMSGSGELSRPVTDEALTEQPSNMA
jgi:hypothetical protein